MIPFPKGHNIWLLSHKHNRVVTKQSFPFKRDKESSSRSCGKTEWLLLYSILIIIIITKQSFPFKRDKESSSRSCGKTELLLLYSINYYYKWFAVQRDELFGPSHIKITELLLSIIPVSKGQKFSSLVCQKKNSRYYQWFAFQRDNFFLVPVIST